MQTENRKEKRIELVDKGLRVLFGVVLLLVALSFLVPIYWMLLNSFKNRLDWNTLGAFDFPSTFNFDNYKFVFENLSYTVTSRDGTAELVYTLPWMYVYSFIWSLGAPAFSVLVTTMCAYVITRYKFPGRNFLYSLGIILMILPIIGSSASALIVRRRLGIYNNMLLMILTGPSVAFSGMNFLMLSAAFKSVPWEYAEAVFIDGGSHMRVFLVIMLPMVMPTVWVLILLSFIGSWNDYMTFMLWMPSYMNVAMGIYNFQYNVSLGLAGKIASTPQVLASFTIAAIPIVILYISFQKIITANFVVGGLKG